MHLSRFFGRRDVRSSRPRVRRRPWIEALEGRQLLAVFTVTNVNDSGAGSLRGAIASADAQTGASTINFRIGTGAQTISPLEALPSVDSHVTIDATSQPGYSGTPLIAIDGSRAGSPAEGLVINGNGVQVFGLAIDHFSGDGVLILGNDNTISSDYIGLRAIGSAAGNGGSGIIIRNGSDNVIGSASSSGRNVISANGWRGVWIDGSSAKGNVIENNRIGTNVAGTSALGNGGDGVSIVGAPDNVVGGTAPGAGNLISGNARVGVWMDGTAASGNVISGNYIGTNVDGTSALRNGLSGVMSQGAPKNTIGGTTAAARNVISGNGQWGVDITGAGAKNNVVQGNSIGTNASGTAALGNANYGVQIDDGAGRNVIGGTGPGAGNTIQDNLRGGVALDDAGTGNLIEGDVINANGFGKSAVGLGSGIVLICSPDSTVAGDTIESNRDWGIIFRDSGRPKLTGNTIEGNGLGSVHDV